jgi:formylglycine-generating enzyme required for sulfatase activity
MVVELQWVDVVTPFRISRDLVAGPDGAPLELSFVEARAYAASVGASLPRWCEWEIAVRGPEPWLRPWGDGGRCAT